MTEGAPNSSAWLAPRYSTTSAEPPLTLGQAARRLGLSKPTLSKAAARGDLHTSRRPDGTFAIEADELARWWEASRHRFTKATEALELEDRVAALEEELRDLRSMLRAFAALRPDE